MAREFPCSYCTTGKTWSRNTKVCESCKTKFWRGEPLAKRMTTKVALKHAKKKYGPTGYVTFSGSADSGYLRHVGFLFNGMFTEKGTGSTFEDAFADADKREADAKARKDNG